MAITFLERKKRQRYLILVLTILILLVVCILWYSFLAKKKPVAIPPPKPPSFKVELDWKTLKDPWLKKLKAFELIQPFEKEIGRENPFLPY